MNQFIKVIFLYRLKMLLQQKQNLQINSKIIKIQTLKMNHQEQFEFRQQVEQFVIKSNVNKVLQSLLQEIMMSKPENPIDFMISKLQQPQRQFNFVIGPPGLRTFSFLQRVRQQTTAHQFQIFNCGQFILNIAHQLSANTKQVINSGLMINKQEINSKVLTKIQDLFKNSKKSVIIQGFPKNLQQAINLQRVRIPPSKVILMNVNDEHLRQICEFKITSNYANLSPVQVEQKVALMVIEHKTNLKQLKNFYNSFSQIDLSKNSSEEYILHELRRAFDIKTVSLTPRTCSHVLIIGAPHSGRTTLAKSFALYYNLVYISTKALISNEIRKDSITGRKIKQQFLNHQLIDQFTIQKLIEERINKTDCLMQGFVVEGYPKTQKQYKNIKSLNLRPTLTLVLDVNQTQSIKRGGNDVQLGKKRYEKWVAFRNHLKTLNDKMFWVDQHLNQQNMFEEVKFQFEKKQ